jgi:Pvc16 N-terminal domain
MLKDSHQALGQLLYRRGKIPEEVDIRYEAPTKQWVDSLIRPTISFFLFDVQENKEKRETNLQTFRGNGRAERRMPPRRIDLMYCVSAFATEVADEHELLWRVLATLMKYEQFPDDVLTDSLRRVEPPLTARIAEHEMSSRLAELWSSLGMPPHAALCYIVTAPMDLDFSIQAPLVLTRTARYRSPVGDATYETALQIGGVVRGKSGNPLDGLMVRRRDSAHEGSITNLEGQFRLGAVPPGRVRLDVLKEGKLRKQVEIEVPAESYEIVLDE